MDSIARFSIAAGAHYPIAVGNNFLSKAFKPKSGFSGTLQYNLNRFFIGFNFHGTRYSISDKSLFGNFEEAESIRANGFVGIRHKLMSKKIYLEHGIGAGKQTFTNYGTITTYGNSGINAIAFSKFNYKILDFFHLYAATEFEYTKFNTIIEGPYKNFYTNTYQITPTLGVKFNIGAPKKLKWIQF